MGHGDSWRNKLVEDGLLDRIDRGRATGGRKPKGGAFEETVIKRLHECKPGDYVRQVLKGKGNMGPLMRVMDPQRGLLESRDGRQERLAPRTQVAVQV
ncbi:MAG: hypothetical protein P9L99_12650 [Candidatus Lernaella stagnicola]|nr:hypothetical protein [Candidatus Lernaella stagnicola]